MRRTVFFGAFMVIVLTSAMLSSVLGRASSREDPSRGQTMEELSASATDTLLFTGVLGGVFSTVTPNLGRVHVRGGLGLSTADYVRGAFDDVPQGISDAAILPALSVVFQVWRGEGFLRQASLTIGTQNGLTNTEYDRTFQLDSWYESNYHVGLAAKYPGGIAAGITYAIGTSPNGVSPRGHEIDLAVGVVGATTFGRLRPALELTIPLGQRDGVFLQLVAEPSFALPGMDALPITLSLPLALGAGISGYHAGEDFTGIGAVGLNSQFGLGFVPPVYGNWAVDLGVRLIARPDTMVEATDPLDDAGNVVVIGNFGLRFVF